MAPVAPITSDSDLEREKWQADLRLRERELSLQEEKLRIEHRAEERSRWANPLVLAVLAATLAAAGNAAVAYINGAAQRELEEARTKAQETIEETKAEAARILEVIKTGDPISARRNLEFLNDIGLITNPERHAAIKMYISKTAPREGPSIPLSPAGRSEIKDDNFDEFINKVSEAYKEYETTKNEPKLAFTLSEAARKYKLDKLLRDSKLMMEEAKRASEEAFKDILGKP